MCSPMSTTVWGDTRGGVFLVVRDQPQKWSAEVEGLHGLNVVIYKVISDGKRTPIIGA